MSAALPGVDVVIATHDRPVWVREAIEAVMAQEYGGRIRCLVVFDGTEPDPALERRSEGREVCVLRNVRTPGLAGARNSGILTGQGELVAFCDDDDVWLPGKLRRQVAELVGGGAPTCVTGIEVVYDGTSTLRVPEPDQLNLRTLLRRRVMAAHPSTVVVRRDALIAEIGLVDEEIPGSYGEDFDWMLRAARAGGFHLVPEGLVRVRWGGSQFSRKWRTIVDAIDYGLEKHPEFRHDRHAHARLLGRRAFALAALHDREAYGTARQAIRTRPLEPRSYLALAVALRLTTAERLLHAAHRHGHGI